MNNVTYIGYMYVAFEGINSAAFKYHRITQDVRGHEGKSKVFVTLRRGKKYIHSLSLALILTLTAILSPNHYTTSNFDHAHNSA